MLGDGRAGQTRPGYASLLYNLAPVSPVFKFSRLPSLQFQGGMLTYAAISLAHSSLSQGMAGTGVCSDLHMSAALSAITYRHGTISHGGVMSIVCQILPWKIKT